MKGTFIISLDFELHWGGFEKWPLQMPNGKPQTEIESRQLINGAKDYNQYFLNTRKVIPLMLQLFEHYNIHVTWATVGMLFYRNRKELLENVPQAKPTYETDALSAYRYIESTGIGENEENDPYHFASSLIKKISSTPHQELGTHTFAHYYCNEPGQTPDQFREDLRAAQRAAAIFDKSLTSLVFPRNQFNDQYLQICFEEGITSVRSNPLDWFWHIDSTQSESAWKRINRGMDAYFPVGKKNTYTLSSIPVRHGFPVCLPASRLLRPYRPKEFFLNTFKVERVKSEMEWAAKHNEVYHLWWHPHNFGRYPAQSLLELESILNHFKYCREKFGMCSLNMGELAGIVLNS